MPLTTDQIFLFVLFGTVFSLLIWGRIRYDLVAFSALVIAVIAGYVTPEEAFSGPGPFPDGRGGGRVLCLSNTDWAQEQYYNHGSGGL